MTKADELALREINEFLDIIEISERARLLECLRGMQEKKEIPESKLVRKTKSSRGPSTDDKRRTMTTAIGKMGNK